MTPEQREELKQAALAAKGWNWNATQGDQFGREEDGSFYDIGTVDADQYSQGGEGEDDYNGTVLRFIAKADPSAILSLIAQVEALTVPKWISVKPALHIAKRLARDEVEYLVATAPPARSPAFIARLKKAQDELSVIVSALQEIDAAPTIPAIPGTKEVA